MDNKNGAVYFIKDKSCNLVKIGFTRNLKRRVKQLGTSNCNLQLIYSIENCNMDYEKFLHNFFKDVRVKKEWFEYEQAMKEWIRRDRLERMVREGII